MQMTKQIRDNPALRESFFRLAEETFGLSFRKWYEDGWWGESYLPYAFAENGEVVANASVNIMPFKLCGVDKNFIQIGTVMTAAAYRNRGLSRALISEILRDWKGKADMIYLFANSSVLDFYPKFGFVKTLECQHTMPVSPSGGQKRRLDMRQPGDRALLKAHFDQSNPYSLLSSVGNDGLLMFYCGSILKENIYYLKEEDAVAVASFEGDEMLCYDIFCDGRRPLQSVLRALAEKETRLVRFGFTPCETGNCSAHTLEGKEDTLFIYQGGENPFTKAQLMFPLLSHA